MAADGYWEDDRTWVEPVPGTGPMAKFEAYVVRITETGKICHYVDGRIAIYDMHDATEVAEGKTEDGNPATVEKVEILVVPING